MITTDLNTVSLLPVEGMGAGWYWGIDFGLLFVVWVLLSAFASVIFVIIHICIAVYSFIFDILCIALFLNLKLLSVQISFRK